VNISARVIAAIHGHGDNGRGSLDPEPTTLLLTEFCFQPRTSGQSHQICYRNTRFSRRNNRYLKSRPIWYNLCECRCCAAQYREVYLVFSFSSKKLPDLLDEAELDKYFGWRTAAEVGRGL